MDSENFFFTSSPHFEMKIVFLDHKFRRSRLTKTTVVSVKTGGISLAYNSPASMLTMGHRCISKRGSLQCPSQCCPILFKIKKGLLNGIRIRSRVNGFNHQRLTCIHFCTVLIPFQWIPNLYALCIRAHRKRIRIQATGKTIIGQKRCPPVIRGQWLPLHFRL